MIDQASAEAAFDAAHDNFSAPGEASLTPLAPGFRHVMRFRLILLWIPLLSAAAVLTLLWDGIPYGGAVFGAIAGFALFTIITYPGRRFERWGYQLLPDRLRVVRGLMFRVDTVVPFVRVQHIDVSQGPIERLFTVSTLTVHTAGTHNSVVDLPGLAPDDANVMRDAIRAQIRSDFG